MLGRDGSKSRDKTVKTVIFPGIAEKIVPIFALEGWKPPFTCFGPKFPFNLCKISKKMSKNL